jgi:hypothetical protein
MKINHGGKLQQKSLKTFFMMILKHLNVHLNVLHTTLIYSARLTKKGINKSTGSHLEIF